VERIGHGVTAIQDKELVRRLAADRVTLEVCISSNLHTGAVETIGQHPLRRFMDAGVPVTLGTDNPTVSATTLSREYLLAIDTFQLSQEEVDRLIQNGHDATFVN
jgi:adenosine deaminase